MKKCNCSTTGTIIEVLETLGHSKNGTYLIYEPVYKYTILGEKYIGQADIISTDPDRYKVNSEAVSYTHLDVYKRQHIFCPVKQKAKF